MISAFHASSAGASAQHGISFRGSQAANMTNDYVGRDGRGRDAIRIVVAEDEDSFPVFDGRGQLQNRLLDLRQRAALQSQGVGGRRQFVVWCGCCSYSS